MHFLVFLITGALTFILPWWLVVPLWLAYVLIYDGYELVLFGICMDAYVGTNGLWSIFYTSVAAAIVAGGHLVRPRLAFYRDY